MPPIPFYSRCHGPYTSYIIVFIGAQRPYASYTILFLVPRPLYLQYFCIRGAMAPMPPILLYSKCPGPYASYIIVF